MKYEKATVEVTNFGSMKIFMKLSSGKICSYFGIIETYNGEYFSCYVVSRGYNQQTGNYTATCSDVDDGFPTGQTIDITNVEFNPAYVVP